MSWDTKFAPPTTTVPGVHNYDHDTNRAGGLWGGNCRDGLAHLKSQHQNQIDKHQQQIDFINKILLTDGPEQAEEAAIRELHEAHPNGMHGGCSCYGHKKLIQVGTSLAVLEARRVEAKMLENTTKEQQLALTTESIPEADRKYYEEAPLFAWIRRTFKKS
jgi:hypothetical protein